MSVVNAGELDREIDIITAVATINPTTGEEVLNWDAAVASVTTVWAQWLPAGTTEAYRAQQRLGMYIEGVFKVYDLLPRPDPKLTKVGFDGRIYDAKPVIEIGRGDGLLIPVTAQTGDVPS